MKVGLCGFGKRIAVVAGLLAQADKRIDICAYADPKPHGLERLMNVYGIPSPARKYDDLKDMLENETLDLLMIGSPNHLHLDHIRQGLVAGVLIFTEKPVVISEAETFTLLDLLAKHGGADRVMVGLVLRYAPLYRRLVQTLQSGSLGRLTSIEASETLSPDHGAFFMRDWRRLEKFSGGFMLEKCCHDLDLYQGVTGCRPMRVTSFGARNIFTAENKALEVAGLHHQRKTGWEGTDKVFGGDADIIDSQTALIEYENGVHLSFHVNVNAPDKFRRFCVFGTKGMAEGDFERNFYRVHDAQSMQKTEEATFDIGTSGRHYGADEMMAGDLARHLFNGAPLPVSVLDALEAGLTAIKIDEARKTGTVVTLAAMWKRFDAYQLKGDKT